MESLDWQGWLTLGVIFLVLIAMVRGIASPDLIMLAGLVILGASGVLTPEETFSGFANPAMMTVGALFILSAAMRETGALEISLGDSSVNPRTKSSRCFELCRCWPGSRPSSITRPSSP